MRLSDLVPGTPFVVSRVLVGGEIGKRLADMGFTDGAAGLLVRGAFLRGPIQVRIRGYDLLIRRGEAKLIEVAMEGDVGAADSVGGAGADVDSGGLEEAAGAAGAGHENEAAGRPYRARRGRSGFLRSLFAEPDCCSIASQGRRPSQDSGAGKRGDASERGDVGHDPNDRKSAC